MNFLRMLFEPKQDREIRIRKEAEEERRLAEIEAVERLKRIERLRKHPVHLNEVRGLRKVLLRPHRGQTPIGEFADAATRLGELGDPEAIDALVFTVACHFGELVVSEAKAALDKIDPHWISSPGAHAAIPLIEASLSGETDSPWMPDLAVRLLGGIRAAAERKHPASIT